MVGKPAVKCQSEADLSHSQSVWERRLSNSVCPAVQSAGSL